MKKQRGMSFGYWKTATADKKNRTDRYTLISRLESLFSICVKNVCIGQIVADSVCQELDHAQLCCSSLCSWMLCYRCHSYKNCSRVLKMNF